jgi:hypothetical protein
MAMVDPLLFLGPAAALLAYPIYVLLMAGVLAICGVSRKDIAKWALRQADRHRVVDLVRAARGLRLPPATAPTSAPAERAPVPALDESTNEAR